MDDPDQPTEIPTGQFVVKVQVPLVEGKGIFPTKEGKASLLVYNKDRSLKGHLGRVKGQEELYDALEKEVRKNGFKGQKGFFPAICKKDSAEVQRSTASSWRSTLRRCCPLRPGELWEATQMHYFLLLLTYFFLPTEYSCEHSKYV